jgi:hypothetical protein
MISLAAPNLSPTKTWARKPTKKGDRHSKREGKDADVRATPCGLRNKALWIDIKMAKSIELRERMRG